MSKRRLGPKRRPDTLIEAFESLDLDGDDDATSMQEEEIKRNDFAPEPDVLDPRYTDERFTVVLDDVSEDEIGGIVQKRHPRFRAYPLRLEKAILRLFPKAQIVPLTRFERILEQNDAVHHMDVRTVFVALEWDTGHDTHFTRYESGQHRRMALAMGKYKTTIGVPLPSFFPGARHGDTLLVVFFTHDVKLKQEFEETARNRPWQGIRRGSAYYYSDKDHKDRSIDVRLYPFFVSENLDVAEHYINRWTVQSLLRYFYDAEFYYDPKTATAREEAQSVNNAARALQEIISQGLAEALPKTLGIELPSRSWDHVSLEDPDGETHQATVDFVRRDRLYDPRLFLEIWKFVYSTPDAPSASAAAADAPESAKDD